MRLLTRFAGERKRLNQRVAVAKKPEKIVQLLNNIQKLGEEMRLASVPKSRLAEKQREILYLEWVARRARGKIRAMGLDVKELLRPEKVRPAKKERRWGRGGPWTQSVA